MDYIGVLFNILVIPLGVYAFWFFLAQRIDGDNDISFFITLIPFWIAGLPLIAFIILTGIAARNTRIDRCEKLLISIVIPIGFLTTIILLLLYIEGLVDFGITGSKN